MIHTLRHQKNRCSRTTLTRSHFPFFDNPEVGLLLSLLPLFLGSLLLLPLPDEGLAVVFTVGETIDSVNVTLGWGGVGEEDTAMEVKLDGLGQS